jgi:hypothetical protein
MNRPSLLLLWIGMLLGLLLLSGCGKDDRGTVPTSPEVCDGVDNDLDGLTDEGFPDTDGDAIADCVDPDDDNDRFSDIIEIAAGSDPLSSLSTPPSHALYVWRDPVPTLNGTPITLVEAGRLADFAVAKGIKTIFYDNYGCGVGCGPVGAERQSITNLAPIIALLHARGLRVEALYTDNTRINSGDPLDVVPYNSAVLPDERFDAIRLNIETFPSRSSEPTTSEDLKPYVDAVADAGTLPVYVSIGHHWDNFITYPAIGGTHKRSYQHILDIVAGVDIQTAQDSPTAIVDITKDELCYGNSSGKPVYITIETYDVASHLGLNSFNTFFEEGEAGMQDTLGTLNYANAPCASPMLAGYAYHFYRQSFGSSDINGWRTVYTPD